MQIVVSVVVETKLHQNNERNQSWKKKRKQKCKFQIQENYKFKAETIEMFVLRLNAMH